MRPNGKWGYYAFPYCFNNKGDITCSLQTCGENNRMNYLWNMADVIFPSVYLSEKLSQDKRSTMVRGRVREAKRVSNSVQGPNKPKILTYIRWVYTDTLKSLSEGDLLDALNAMQAEGSEGVVLWGSSFDLDTKFVAVFLDFKSLGKISIFNFISEPNAKSLQITLMKFWDQPF